MRVAVVANHYGDAWRERDVLTRRLAGALACSSDVDILLPGSKADASHDGAVRLLRFPATLPDPGRRQAWRKAVFGLAQEEPFRSGAQVSRDFPDLVEQELVRAEGGESPALYEYLLEAPYDLVVFVGYHSPAACWGSKALPDDQRFVIVPAAREDPSFWLRIHDETFHRADLVVVSSQTEAELLRRRLGHDQKLVDVGFSIGVNLLALSTPPHDLDGDRFVVVAADWNAKPPLIARMSRWATRLQCDIDPKLDLRLVGPGAERYPWGAKLTGSRLDVWRWVCHSVALLDPTHHRLLGQDVLEAMLLETAVITHADGGAAREHADVGNGGLWYRTEDELCAVVRALLDEDLRRTLAEQGRTYVQERYADPDSYVKRVREVFLS